MLRTYSMPRSENAALEQVERRFNGVRMDIAVHVQVDAVHDCLVFCAHSCSPSCAAILSQVIGHQDFDIIGNILSDVLFKLFKRSRTHVIGMKGSQFTLANCGTGRIACATESPKSRQDAGATGRKSVSGGNEVKACAVSPSFVRARQRPSRLRASSRVE